ncbi:hypothetical protein [Sphingomonas oryzagri]|uniref:Transcriptional regulator n=1 Tax=Sphingomonas oryzagri TaxID=3042314 RepID=A0ABT6N0U9_9SPHN|nr:hypothetical protein [Sphingomonas oryzagri]MDH7638934.1 hypothetical protein [Sphingomonas oryzagri]
MARPIPVRPPVHRLTDADARHYLAAGLLKVCHEHGPSRVGLEIGCDEKTVRRARDEDSTLGLACAFNLLDVDGRALDAIAAAKGFRFVPIEVAETVDAIVAQSATIHKLAAARDPNGPGGVVETDDELIGMEAEVIESIRSLQSIRNRIVAAKARRAAA